MTRHLSPAQQAHAEEHDRQAAEMASAAARGARAPSRSAPTKPATKPKPSKYVPFVVLHMLKSGGSHTSDHETEASARRYASTVGNRGDEIAIIDHHGNTVYQRTVGR